MVSRRRFLALVGTATPVIAAAGLGYRLLPGESTTPGSTPVIRWDEEPCAHCRMLISDRRYAAAWIEPGGRQMHFDDIGCMVSAMHRQAPPTASLLFARDYAEDTWLDAAVALYVRADILHSPMAYGVAAFRNRPAAVAALGVAASHFQSWDELTQTLAKAS
jgi:copper chaperone NosL